MKKMLCLVFAIVMCFGLVVPAFAAEDTFTPSVAYKDAPELVTIQDPEGNEAIGVVKNGEGEIISYIYAHCLVITPVAEAETSTEIPEAARQTLLSVYAALLDNSMKIPYEKFNANLDPDHMVIRDLFDATFICEEHPEMLAAEGVVLELMFKMNIKEDVEVFASTYNDGQWNPIVSTVNNGDGTVTCTFEHLCPVAFSVPTDSGPSLTGDSSVAAVMPWVALLSVSAVALGVLLVVRRKQVG